MPNQMIALQARNPQLPDPNRITSQMANMMNMAQQQRTAERQSALAQQTMDINKAQEARAEKTQTAALRKSDLDFQIEDTKRLRNIGVAVLQSGNEDAYQSWLGMVENADPQLGATLRQVAPNFNPEIMQSVLMEADKYIDKTVPTAEARVEYAAKGGVDAQGRPVPEGAPIQVITGLRPSTTPIAGAPAANAGAPAPRATPTAPQVPAVERAPSAASDAPMTFGPDETRPLNAYQQEDLNRLQSELGMTDTPASFARGGMGGAGATQVTPEIAQQIVDSAVKTRVMAQADFDQLMALTPEQNKKPFMDMIRSNGITLQPNAPSLAGGAMGQRPQSQFADMRGAPPQSQTAGLRGAAPMGQTLAQYQPLQRRDPNVSPLPGSSQVPLSRVAGEAEARRETPAQIQARKTAELQATEQFEEANKAAQLSRKREEVFAGERAKKDATFLDSYNDAASKGRTTLNVIDQMIGDAKVEKGSLVIPKGGRRPHPGFESVVGAGVPGLRFIPGTQSSSFDALFRQAEGGAFLQAYESLRGTGQITEIEGSKATSALTRMERSQTEVEFVKAAREFADVIRGAIARADKRYTALTGEAPPTAPTRRRTPTTSGGGWGKAKVVGN